MYECDCMHATYRCLYSCLENDCMIVPEMFACLAWLQFAAVMKKNVRVMSRNRRDLAQELAIPLLMLTGLAVLCSLNPSRFVTSDGHPASETLKSLSQLGVNKQLVFAPCLVSNVVDVAGIVSQQHGVNFTCFDCEMPSQCNNSILAAYPTIGDTVLAAIVFEGEDMTWDGSSAIFYKLLMDRDRYVPGAMQTTITPLFRSDGSYNEPDSVPREYAKYFLPIQLAVDEAIMSVFGAVDHHSSVSLRSFPTPAHITEGFNAVLRAVLPIYITAIFTLQVRVLLTRILEEKERKIKVTLQIMGLKDSVYWISWFATALLKVGVLSTIVAIITCHANIFPYSDPGLVWLYFFMFGITAIAYCFAITTLFSRAAFGAVVGMLIYLASAAPAYALRTSATSFGLKAFLSLFAPCGFNLGVSIITELELRRVGLTRNNLADATATAAGISVSSIMGLLAFDAMLYFTLAWYLDKVVPSEFGTQQHPFFFLGCKNVARKTTATTPLHVESVQEVTVCPLPQSPAPATAKGVVLCGLTREFTDQKRTVRRAVDDLSLTFEENKVTCLLGHNGAGKTTTISMLTGLLAPTSGDAWVYGHSIVSGVAAVRSLIGYCPQGDVLLHQLSVLEHMELMAGVKGLDANRAKEQIRSLLEQVMLLDKCSAWGNELSGGMKRRLSLAMALLGEPKVLMLDEPTSGLDPSARRFVWKLVQKYKQDRVVILTTHFMDEADVLGDEIALMARGKLRVSGSPLFFKKKFGSGYQLKIQLRSDNFEQCKLHLLQQVQQFVPEAELVATAVDQHSPISECLILLPQHQAGRFSQLFEALEREKNGTTQLITSACHSIVSIMNSMTSLEDAYLRLAKQLENEPSSPVDANMHSIDCNEATMHSIDCNEGDARTVVEQPDTWLQSRNRIPQTRFGRFSRGVCAILWRRSLEVRRNPRAIWLQCVVPLIFVGVGVIFRLARAVGEPPATTSINMAAPMYSAWNAAAYGESQTIFQAMNTSVANTTPKVYFSGSETNSSLIDLQLLQMHNTAFTVESSAPDAVSFAYNYTLTNILPVAMSMYNGARLIRLSSAFSNWASIPLHTTFAALPKLTVASTPTIGDFVTSSLLGLYIGLGFITIPAIQANVVVRERETHVKQLQTLVMGGKTFIYWTGMWAWDIMQYSLPFMGGLAIVFASSHSSFRVAAQYGAVVVLLGLFGVVMPLQTYVLSFAFEDAAVAQKYTRVGFSALLLLFFVTTFVLEFPGVSNPSLRILSAVISHVGYLFPPFALAKGYGDVVTLGSCSSAVIVSGLPCDAPHAFSWALAGAKIAFMALSIPCWFYLLMRRETQAVFSFSPSSKVSEMVETEDADVATESASVQRAASENVANTNGLIVQNLRKLYNTNKRHVKLAVKRVNLHVPKGEIFGLLGPNGAGKSTTLSMLVMDVEATEGCAWIDGKRVDVEVRQANSALGYCPQNDALFDLLTGEETLMFFFRLNGCDADESKRLAQQALLSVDLHRSKHTLAKAYSGGNRRRLCLALAFVNDPKVVFLDECSTGVDPFARRRMFELIRKVGQNRSIIMTTHVMEEADALCSRIGIMVDGRLACIGTPQHLKDKYGRGYLVELVFYDIHNKTAADELVAQFASEFRCLECNNSHVRYEVQDILLGPAFRVLQSAVECKQIRDYSVSHTTLEAVFLTFSRIQEAINGNRNGTD